MRRNRYQRKQLQENKLFLINEVSRIVNLSQKRIREYEKEGFVKPIRENSTNNRLYSEFEIAQIQRINALIHDRGFTLALLASALILAGLYFQRRAYKPLVDAAVEGARPARSGR